VALFSRTARTGLAASTNLSPCAVEACVTQRIFDLGSFGNIPFVGRCRSSRRKLVGRPGERLRRRVTRGQRSLLVCGFQRAPILSN
jgi:hypothetical protein